MMSLGSLPETEMAYNPGVNRFNLNHFPTQESGGSIRPTIPSKLEEVQAKTLSLLCLRLIRLSQLSQPSLSNCSPVLIIEQTRHALKFRMEGGIEEISMIFVPLELFLRPKREQIQRNKDNRNTIPTKINDVCRIT